MYKYRIYPSKKQQIRLINSFKICKEIYNKLLEISIETYKSYSKTLGRFDYNKHLARKYPNIPGQVKQNVSHRLHQAFQNFFRKVKDKSWKKKGFPRFKNKVNSMTYPSGVDGRGKRCGFWFNSEKRLYISKIGIVPIVIHRPIKGKIKTLTIKKNSAGQWFAVFVCEIDFPQIKLPSKKRIGIDLGIENFATISNGELIENPRHIIKAEKRLKLLHRRLNRKKKRSINWRKAKFRLARQYLKVSNQRTDFLHKWSHKISRSYSFIAVEDLNVKNMVKNHYLAKSINDASWNKFIQMLSYKAVTCGGQLVKVNPRNTSKTCNECGVIVDMPLSKREFQCPECGFTCHRDLNASLNILSIATGCGEFTPVGDTVRPSMKARIIEAGTICNKS